jgi:hypothetical protein
MKLWLVTGVLAHFDVITINSSSPLIPLLQLLKERVVIDAPGMQIPL